jgi:hypothetical protein
MQKKEFKGNFNKYFLVISILASNEMKLIFTFQNILKEKLLERVVLLSLILRKRLG